MNHQNQAQPTNYGCNMSQTYSPPDFPPSPSPHFPHLINRVPTSCQLRTPPPNTSHPKPHTSQLGVFNSKLELLTLPLNPFRMSNPSPIGSLIIKPYSRASPTIAPKPHWHHLTTILTRHHSVYCPTCHPPPPVRHCFVPLEVRITQPRTPIPKPQTPTDKPQTLTPKRSTPHSSS